jgi:hypothetical protein
MTEPLILGNALVSAEPQAPSPKPQGSRFYTTVPGAIVPSFGTTMMPLRM